MLIVVACNGFHVARTLDGADCYSCYSATKGILSGCRTLPNLKFTAKKTAETFAGLEASVIICGSFTPIELDEFELVGIDTFAGASGLASEAANGYLTHTLCGIEEDLDEE